MVSIIAVVTPKADSSNRIPLGPEPESPEVSSETELLLMIVLKGYVVSAGDNDGSILQYMPKTSPELFTQEPMLLLIVLFEIFRFHCLFVQIPYWSKSPVLSPLLNMVIVFPVVAVLPPISFPRSPRKVAGSGMVPLPTSPKYPFNKIPL